MQATPYRSLLAALSSVVVVFCNQAFAQEPFVPWIQLPGFLVYTNDPAQWGGNRPSNFDWNQMMEANTNSVNAAVADDFVSDGYTISRIRWWGSYFGTFEPASLTNFFEEGYVFSFFAHSGTSPSILLGTYVAPMSALTAVRTGYTGEDGRQIFVYEVDLTQACLEYQASANFDSFGFTGDFNRRYWLSIQAQVGRRFSSVTNESGTVTWLRESTGRGVTNDFWGWHTSPTNRNASSTSGEVAVGETNLIYLPASWRTNDVLDGERDQAFEVWSGCGQQPPALVSVVGYCNAHMVKVTFSKPPEPFSYGEYIVYATNRHFYPWTIVFDPNPRTFWILFHPETPLPCDSALTLTVTFVFDFCGNQMPETSLPFQCPPCEAPDLVTAWSQKPTFLVRPDDPQLKGVERYSDFNFNFLLNSTNIVQPNRVVADDFRADGRVIRTIKWWGAYPRAFEPDPLDSTRPFYEDAYVLSFFRNANVDGVNFPGELIGTYVAPMTVFSAYWGTGYFTSNTNRIFRYELELWKACFNHAAGSEARPYGFVGVSNAVYWLSISAEVGQRFTGSLTTGVATNCIQEPSGKSTTLHFWSWLSSQSQQESISANNHVRFQGGDWTYLQDFWQTIASVQDERDQAFELLTVPGDCSPEQLDYTWLGAVPTPLGPSPLLSLAWSSADYMLEYAPSISGPWSVIASRSPQLVDARGFYRLRCLFPR